MCSFCGNFIRTFFFIVHVACEVEPINSLIMVDFGGMGSEMITWAS
jgi:hypothetical protein